MVLLNYLTTYTVYSYQTWSSRQWWCRTQWTSEYDDCCWEHIDHFGKNNRKHHEIKLREPKNVSKIADRKNLVLEHTIILEIWFLKISLKVHAMYYGQPSVLFIYIPDNTSRVTSIKNRNNKLLFTIFVYQIIVLWSLKHTLYA